MAINIWKAAKVNAPSPSEAEHSMRKLPNGSTCMNAISISVSLLIALVAVLVFYRMRKLQQISSNGIAKDVPILRLDYVSIGGMLLGVWEISYSGKCDPGCREIERRLSP